MQSKIDRKNVEWDHLTSDQQEIAYGYFDEKYYKSCNPDVQADSWGLFQHYLKEGWRQGRNPNSAFITVDYFLKHPEIVGTGLNPLFHNLFRDHNGAFDGLSAQDIVRLRAEFDPAYYLDENPDVRMAGVDPFLHYMRYGWKEKRDPSPDFSTHFYLTLHRDISEAGMNPFVHWALYGKQELRPALSFSRKLAKKRYAPKVSAIVPNYNHGRFLAQRLDSILAQTYPNIDILVLDDCSKDDSREVIDSYVARYPDRIRTIYNETNSGGVFKQWRKGVEAIDGEIVWICESDDFCEPDFVEKLVPKFADDSVQMAFGRILEVDTDGAVNYFLDTYRENSEAGIWGKPLVRPAADWFAHGFGINNVIANVGGCLFRRSPVPLHVWEEAATYRVVGDWYLYLQIASGGQIAWEPEAVSYFRRHGTNTSSSSFDGTRFYSELERVMIEMRRTWDVPNATVTKFYNNFLNQYQHFQVDKEHGPFDLYCNLDKMLAVKRQRGHIVLAMLGFVPGGGENFPIQLANSLVEAGWVVSLLVFVSSEVNEHMRASLNPAVSVYDAAWITEYGCERFIREAGVSLIHSHTVGAEMHFYHLWDISADVPYVVTLHGSYEASDIPPAMMVRITESVDHFVYTADKNLLPLQDQNLPDDHFTKMANAMPIDPLPYPQTRAEMGISEDAIVFTLVARGIKRKGWRAAIEAFRQIRSRNPHRPMHLCMVGEGEEPDFHREKHGNDPDISFLGYQLRIHGLYRISDVAVVPTRFAGESYPLCIIQSLQAGTPVVASDVGEIRNMLENEAGVRGGIVVDAHRDTDVFIDLFAKGMEQILDDRLRQELREGAMELGRRYDMEPLVEIYGNLYSQIIGQVVLELPELVA